jgi:glycosyltransferase A (GT-A) superfamily protein (DUF2064 family)
LTLKLLLLVRTVEVRTALAAVLGEQVAAKLLQSSAPSTLSQPSQSMEESIWRIIGSEACGQPLESTADTAAIHRCEHLEMRRRGNKTAKWWTCLDCNGRWTRVALDDLALTPEVLAVAATTTARTSEGRFVRRLAENALDSQQFAMQDD